MAHGGYTRHRVSERRPMRRSDKGLTVDKKKKKKQKSVSLKNQIRSTERILRKDLPLEVREAQKKKLEELKKQEEIKIRLAIERKMFLRDRKIKFFERRKVERMIRRLEKQHRAPSDQTSEASISAQLSKLKEDLEYIRFFPKTEKYVSLFVGGDNADVVEKRNKLRKQIKDNLIAAAASGKDLEETGSDDDEHVDMSEDDFFLTGSSSDEDADDEWTDKSAREPASSTSGKAASGVSSDEKNQRQLSDRARMPPPRPNGNSFRTSGYGQGRSSGRNQNKQKVVLSTSSNTSHSRSDSSVRNWDYSNVQPDHSRNSFRTSGYGQTRSSGRHQNKQNAVLSTSSNTSHSRSGPSSRNWVSSSTRADQSSNLSSNSDAHKPRRKRRPKKKKQAA